MKNVGLGLALLFLAGCGANFFSCSTEASFNADGTWHYKSCKNQENFKAEIGKDKLGNPIAKVETTATTAESAMAAAMHSQAALMDMLRELMPILSKGAMAGS